MTQPTCQSCGTSLPAGSPAGLCPRCLLKRGMEANTAGFTVPEAPRSRWQPPEIAELAAQFPELEIIELLGRGGMGAVYKARQKNLDRLVALKILPPEIGQSPAFAERFAREAQAMARLNHPNIVTLHEFGQRGNLFFFIMEFVDGMSLRGLLDSGHVSPKEALAIVPQICEALQYAHDQGIVHRDIKPENILLNKQGQVKIADFGLAKLMGRTVGQGLRNESDMSGEGISPLITHHSSLITSPAGTPQYMAPEQLDRPAEVDHRADIYSLGVVFYQMLTGELPAKLLEPPSRKVQIDVRLDQIVLRALEQSPQLRYQNATEFKTEIETVIATPSEISNLKSQIPPQSTPGPAIGFNLEWDRGHGHPPGYFKKHFPIVGIRNAKRVISWPGMLLAIAFVFSIIELGAFAFYAAISTLNHEWLPPQYLLIPFFVVPLVVGFWIRQAFNKPLDQLPSLDAPSPSEISNLKSEIPTPPAPPHFSRTAIIGASWSVFAFFAVLFGIVASKEGGPGQTPTALGYLLAFTVLPLGIAAPFATTILGIISLSQIRHSNGRLYGLGLALFDTLLFPLLLLDLVISAGWYLLLVFWPYRPQSSFGDMLTVMAWSLIATTAFTIISCIFVNFFIIKWAWHAANKPSAADISSPKSAIPSPRRLGIISLILSLFGLLAELLFLFNFSIQFWRISTPVVLSLSVITLMVLVAALILGIIARPRWTAKIAIILAITGILWPLLNLRFTRIKPFTSSPTTTPALAAAGFGRVTELSPRLLNIDQRFDKAALTECFINFHTGQLVPMPPDLVAQYEANNADPQVLAWVRDHVHALCFYSAAQLSLTCSGFDGFLATPADNDAWQNLTPAALREKLDSLENTANPRDARDMKPRETFPATFLFRSRDGDQGILQFLGYADARQRIKIRYKLLQQSPTSMTTNPYPAALDFRIAFLQSDIQAALPAAVDSLAKNGPAAPVTVNGTPARWFELYPDAPITLNSTLALATHNGQTFLLCYDDHDHTLTHRDPKRNPWSVSAANPYIDNNGYITLPLKFDPAAAAYMGDLTAANQGHPLAILLDDRALNAPTLMSRITDAAVINFFAPTPTRPTATLRKAAQQIKDAITPAPQSPPATQPAQLPKDAMDALQSIRQKIEIYNLQHLNHPPTLAQLQNSWSVMTTRTDADGNIKPDGPFGPYFTTVPENPIMRLAAVAPHGEAWSRAGWTYDEKTFQFRAIIPAENYAASMSPDNFEKIDPQKDQEMLTREEHAATAATLLNSLQTKVTVYWLAHGKTFPTFSQLQPDWLVFLNKTDTAGKVSDQGQWGPYLPAAPINPFTGKSQLAPHDHPTPDAGWTFDDPTHQFRLLAPDSMPLGTLRDDQVERFPIVAPQGTPTTGIRP